MFFTVKNEAGSLMKAVEAIGKNGFNLRALKSRPTKEANWEYYFSAEGEGTIADKSGRRMLEDLEEFCDRLKVVGHYASEL
jgi:prephenate dehydratase